jgi:outer membrane receptor protein involved in Fe transport
MDRHSKTQLPRQLMRLGVLTAALVAGGVAQAQMAGAIVRGHIYAQEAVPAGTDVVAINKATGATSRAKTLSDGSYTLVGLSPGRYEVRVGGASQGVEVQLAVGESASLDLRADGVKLEKVTVVGSAQRQNVTGSEVGTNISTKMIEALPQNSRNFLSAVDLTPGVRFNTDASGNTKIQAGSQGIDTVNVYIDGVGHKNNILRGGLIGQDTSQGNPFPQGAIAEYKVLTQNYKAEYDQVSSAAISAVTKTGTNEFHGNVYIDRTGDNWTAYSPVERKTEDSSHVPRPTFKQVQEGFSLTGPIKKDALLFSMAYDGKDIDRPAQIQLHNNTALPNAGTVPTLAAKARPFTQKFSEHLGFAKITALIDDEQTLDVSTTLRREKSYSINSDYYTSDTAINNKNKETRLDIKHEFARGPWLNELRLGYENSSWNPQSDASSPLIEYKYSPTGTLQNSQDVLFDGGSPNAQNRAQKGTYVKDDLTYTGLSGHLIKGGVQFKAMKYVLAGTAFRVDSVQTIIDNTTGNIFYANGVCTGTNVASNGLSSDQCSISKAIPAVDVGMKNNQFGIYLQDDWDLTKQLQLNLGARWDYESNMLNNSYATPADRVAAVLGPDGRTIAGITAPAGQTYAQSLAKGGININDYISTGSSRKAYKGALAPRLGFSYDTFGDKQTVVYGGFGRSFDRKMANNALDELQKNAQPGGEIWMINNHFKMPYSDQFSLGVRQAVGVWNVDATLSRIQAKNQFIWFGGNRDPNGGWGTQSPTDPLWGGPNGYGTLVLGDFVGKNKSTELMLKAEKPYTEASGWSVTAAYTYTDAKTTMTNWDDDIFDWTYGKSTYGYHPSTLAEKQRLVVGGFSDRLLPWDIGISGKMTLGSGQPRRLTNCSQGFSACVSTEANSNAFRQFDLSLTKNFKFAVGQLTVRADVLNLFNVANWGYYDDWVGGPGNPQNYLGGDNANLGAKTGVRGPMRTFKLGASYSF